MALVSRRPFVPLRPSSFNDLTSIYSNSPRHMDVRSSILSQMLPAIYRQAVAGESHVAEMIAPYIRSSALLNSFEPVPSRSLQTAYLDVFRGIQVSHVDTEAACHQYLTQKLNLCFRRDTQYMNGTPSYLSRFPRTLQYFRCLGDVSRSNGSWFVGNILFSFWMEQCDIILAEEDNEMLFLWLHAIMEAYMSPEEQARCMDRA